MATTTELMCLLLEKERTGELNARLREWLRFEEALLERAEKAKKGRDGDVEAEEAHSDPCCGA